MSWRRNAPRDACELTTDRVLHLCRRTQRSGGATRASRVRRRRCGSGRRAARALGRSTTRGAPAGSSARRDDRGCARASPTSRRSRTRLAETLLPQETRERGARKRRGSADEKVMPVGQARERGDEVHVRSRARRRDGAAAPPDIRSRSAVCRACPAWRRRSLGAISREEVGPRNGSPLAAASWLHIPTAAQRASNRDRARSAQEASAQPVERGTGGTIRSMRATGERKVAPHHALLVP